LNFIPILPGCEGVSYDSEYGGVAQKWLLIRSEQAYKREQHNLNKRMLKAGEQARKSFKQLCQQRFACAQDAQTAIVKWRGKQAVCDVDAQVIDVAVYSGAGRPKLGALPTRIEYQITGALCTPLASRRAALQQLGLFIIATNDVGDDLDMASLLSRYKAQQNVEKDFRFLKSPDFLTSAIYLKKPERIEALLMVMTCCLMVYAGLEHQIRKTLVEKDCYFPSMKYKPVQRPTARWVFQCFEGITIIYLPDKIPIVANLETRNQTIIDCLGEKYQKIYS
jgi:transposase